MHALSHNSSSRSVLGCGPGEEGEGGVAPAQKGKQEEAEEAVMPHLRMHARQSLG